MYTNILQNNYGDIKADFVSENRVCFVLMYAPRILLPVCNHFRFNVVQVENMAVVDQFTIYIVTASVVALILLVVTLINKFSTCKYFRRVRFVSPFTETARYV